MATSVDIVTLKQLGHAAWSAGFLKGTEGRPLVDAAVATLPEGEKIVVLADYEAGVMVHGFEDAFVKLEAIMTSDAMVKAVADVFGAAAVAWIANALGQKKP